MPAAIWGYPVGEELIRAILRRDCPVPVPAEFLQ